MAGNLGSFNPFSWFRRVKSKFTLLLLFLAFQGIVASLAGDELIFQKILYFYSYLVLLAAVSAIVENRIRLYLFVGLFALSLGCTIAYFQNQYLAALAVSEAADLVMLGMTAFGILQFMLRQKRVTRDLIAGAICIYLLMGAVWANAYALCLLADPAAVSGLSGAGNIFLIKKELSYFSFITMLTIGYGDMAPVSDLAKSFAVLQGVFGQMYIAVFVASVIGMFLSQEQKERLEQKLECSDRDTG